MYRLMFIEQPTKREYTEMYQWCQANFEGNMQVFFYAYDADGMHEDEEMQIARIEIPVKADAVLFKMKWNCVEWK